MNITPKFFWVVTLSAGWRQ